jgi:plasmid stability protein
MGSVFALLQFLRYGCIMEEFMATLNVKDFPDELYGRLRERAARERRSVAQEVIHLLDEAVAEPEPLSLLALRGLGKEQWAGIDAVSHIDGERESWGS